MILLRILGACIFVYAALMCFLGGLNTLSFALYSAKQREWSNVAGYMMLAFIACVGAIGIALLAIGWARNFPFS